MGERRIKDFRPAARNANQHTARGLGALTKSVEADGWIGAMTAAADGEMIAGSARIETVAQMFGVDVEPIVVESDGSRPIVVVRTDLADARVERARRLAIADNRVGELDLAWDVEVLVDSGVEVLGELWTPAEISEMGDAWEAAAGKAPDVDPGPEIDKAQELGVKWDTSPGQTWRLGDHLLLCGDCTDAGAVRALMGSELAELLLTDPPYGVGYVGKTEDALEIEGDDAAGVGALILASFGVAADNMMDRATFYAFSPPGPLFLDFALSINATAGLTWRQTLIWVKNCLVLGHSDYHYRHEPIFYGSKGQRGLFLGGRTQTSMQGLIESGFRKISGDEWQVQIDGEVYVVRGKGVTVTPVSVDVILVDKPSRSALHPTIKPIELVERLLANSSSRGGLVYDPFSGSGTTLCACERLGRRCRAVEIDPKYVAVALERWAVMTGKIPEVVREG